jgi:hypothetical protein
MWRIPDKLFDRDLNLGLGFMVDDDVKILGDGFEENQLPPPGETEIRYRMTDQVSLLFVVSIAVGDKD